MATEICDILQERLDPDTVHLACELFPRGSLKRRSLKYMFAWCGKKRFRGRLFTNKMVTSVVRKLCHAVQLQPPPGTSQNDFVRRQSSRLKSLLKAAKKLEAWRLFCTLVSVCCHCVQTRLFVMLHRPTKRPTKRRTSVNEQLPCTCWP